MLSSPWVAPERQANGRRGREIWGISHRRWFTVPMRLRSASIGLTIDENDEDAEDAASHYQVLIVSVSFSTGVVGGMLSASSCLIFDKLSRDYTIIV